VADDRLSREAIVDAALRIADESGITDVSMHGVAKALGVGTMTLYTYVRGKDDLLDAMADRVVSRIPLPPPGEPWARLRALALGSRTAAEEHPSLPGLIMMRAPKTPAMLAPLELTMAELQAVGLSEADAARASQAMWALVGGWLLGVRTGVLTSSEVEHVTHQHFEGFADDGLEFAVDTMLAGLRTRAERA